MYGRYGSDLLNAALAVIYGVLLVLYMVTGLDVLFWIGFGLVCWALFRMMSRNYQARRAENAKFQKIVDPIIRWFRLQRNIHTDKEHRYFKCPNCGQQLRVPKGKGRITVKCRSCGASFEEKS